MNEKNIPDFIVIDDDPANNLICELIIQEALEEVNVQSFTSPEAGLAYIRLTYSDFDANNAILFLDINMPTLSGWEVLEEFNKAPDSVRQHVKIFMLSSSIYPNDKQRADKNPLVLGYIEKPLTILQVQTILADSLKLT